MTGPAAGTGPANVLVVLLDSLNRHLLGAYGGTEFATPNLDAFARRSTRFTNHVTGSLPCMPARHDILCGALDFLWKPWGSIELWEQSLTALVRRSGATTMLVTDHPHLFEAGGENYHVDFHGWEYVRGHESDPWKTYLDPSWAGTPSLPAERGAWFMEQAFGIRPDDPHRAYDRARTFFREETDFPGPRTMRAAADWLRHATPHHDRWFCFVDEFDPHEPFDVPDPWYGRYEDERWAGEALIWPPYADGAVSEGRLTEAQARHLRANYGAKLTMIDHWFGELMAALDEQQLWDTTAVIVTTDHGHYLGDIRRGRDIWGKPGVPQFEPLGHIPLMVHWPGRPPDTNDALTTNVDLFATVADVFGVTPAHRTHGRSLVPVLRDDAPGSREWAIGGVYGNWVQVTDGRRKYARASVGDGFPLSMWSNRWSTMPIELAHHVSLPTPDDRAVLDRMPGSTIPVIRQPFRPGDLLPFWAGTQRIVDDHHCYDIGIDPDEHENRRGGQDEKELTELLRVALTEVEAPAEQFARLGLG